MIAQNLIKSFGDVISAQKHHFYKHLYALSQGKIGDICLTLQACEISTLNFKNIK